MEDILNLLKQMGAFLEGHFVLSSGLHSKYYIQCAQVLQYPDIANKLASIAKDKFSSLVDIYPDVVVSPALGGILWGYELARVFNNSNNNNCRAIFTERDSSGTMVLRRNFEIKNTDNVIIAEDVITTGLSTNEVISVVTKFSTNILGIVSIVDRSKDDVKFSVDIPRVSLLRLEIDNYTREDCPLCKQNIEIIKPGSRNIVL